MKRNLFLSMAPALMVLLACSEQKAAVDHSHDGLTKVSLGDNQLFQGDITKVPGWNRMVMPNRQTPVSAAKATPLSLIPFKEARVMVLWYNVFDTTFDECREYQDVAAAFGGRKLNKWDQIIAGCRLIPSRELVYEGTLKKSTADSSVKGDIYVKSGLNIVNIAFIDAGDTITYMGFAHYINLDGLNLDIPGEINGWFDMGMGQVWTTWQHRKIHDSFYNTDYYLVYGTNNATPMIGFNKAYADYMCTYIP